MAQIDFYAAEDFKVGSNGTYMSFQTTASNTTTESEKMRLDASGTLILFNSGINTCNQNINAGTGVITGQLAYSNLTGLCNNFVYANSSLAWSNLVNIPSLLSNSSSLEYSNIAGLCNNYVYANSSLGWSNLVNVPTAILSNTGTISNCTISNLTVPTALTVSGIQSNNNNLALSKNCLYLDDGNKGIVYSGALSTFNSNFTSTDGIVLYGWNGGALATSTNANGSIRQSNLNATAYWNTTGVGIFRSNPAYALDVNGTAQATTLKGNLDWVYIQNSPAYLSNQSTINQFTTSNLSVVSSLSNTGITTLKNLTDDMNGAHVYFRNSSGNLVTQMLNYGNDNFALNFDSYWDGTNWRTSSGTGSYQIYKFNGSLQFNSAKAVANSTITWSNAMTINSNGNMVLGGTMTASNSIFGYDGYGQARFWYSTTNNSMIQRYDGTTFYMLFSGTSNGNWNTLRPLSIVAASGNVGINQAAPAYTLDVNGTINCTTLQGSLAYSSLTSVPAVLSNTSAAYTFSCNAATYSSNQLPNYVLGSTLSNASYALMVNKSSPQLACIWSPVSSWGSLDFLYSSSAYMSTAASARIYCADTNYSANMSFQTRTPGSDNSNMNTRMHIQSTGNVGIGTTSPGSLLDVNGNVNCTSFTTNGSLTACNSTISNLTVNGIVQTGLQYPSSDPGMMVFSKYADPKDYYGYGQFGLGTVGGHLWILLRNDL